MYLCICICPAVRVGRAWAAAAPAGGAVMLPSPPLPRPGLLLLLFTPRVPAANPAAAASDVCAAASSAAAGWPHELTGSGRPYRLQQEPVPRVPWSAFLAEHGGQGWRRALIEHGLPIVFTGGISVNWTAPALWQDADYWATHVSGAAALGNCYFSPARIAGRS